jgi:hypothetical protein
MAIINPKGTWERFGNAQWDRVVRTQWMGMCANLTLTRLHTWPPSSIVVLCLSVRGRGGFSLEMGTRERGASGGKTQLSASLPLPLPTHHKTTTAAAPGGAPKLTVPTRTSLARTPPRNRFHSPTHISTVILFHHITLSCRSVHVTTVYPAASGRPSQGLLKSDSPVAGGVRCRGCSSSPEASPEETKKIRPLPSRPNRRVLTSSNLDPQQ